MIDNNLWLVLALANGYFAFIGQKKIYCSKNNEPYSMYIKYNDVLFYIRNKKFINIPFILNSFCYPIIHSS